MPVAMAIVGVVGLHVILPARYRVQPAWVLPVVLLALLAVMIAGDPGRIDRQKTWLRVLMGIIIAFLTVANLVAALRLVVDILTNNKLYANNPGGERAAGGVIWARRCSSPTTCPPAGCRGSSTTCSCRSGPLPPSVLPTR